VVAGLPGAGKSTALRKLQAHGLPGGFVVLDSGSVRAWLQPRLARIPYPALRPVVHAVHWVRILALTLTQRGPVVVHETATRPLSRRALRTLARCGRRPAHLVWIEVPAGVALRGQVDRCRVIRPDAFARHLLHVENAHPVDAAGGTWDAVYSTGRDGATVAIIAALTGSTCPGDAVQISGRRCGLASTRGGGCETGSRAW
jgi:predicted kinase